MTLTQLIEQRRFKVLRIPKNVIETILFNWHDCDSIALPQWEGLPKGAIVIDSTFDFFSDSFFLRLAHESFDAVPQGESCPSFEHAFVSMLWVKLSSKFTNKEWNP